MLFSGVNKNHNQMMLDYSLVALFYGHEWGHVPEVIMHFPHSSPRAATGGGFIGLVCPRFRLVSALCYEGLELRRWHLVLLMMLDSLISVGDQGYEEAEHHVDKQWDEGVQIESAEQPHHGAPVPHVQESGVHIISIYQRKQALGHFIQRPEFVVMWPKYNPSTEAVAEVDHRSTTAKSYDIWECCSQGQY